MGNEIVKADEIRLTEMRQLHAEIVLDVRMTLEKAMRVGDLLFEQKENMSHGQFTHWVTENAPFKLRTAQRYMKYFKNKDQLKNDNVSLLSAANLLLTHHNKYPDHAERKIKELLNGGAGGEYLFLMDEADVLENMLNLIEQSLNKLDFLRKIGIEQGAACCRDVPGLSKVLQIYREQWIEFLDRVGVFENDWFMFCGEELTLLSEGQESINKLKEVIGIAN